MHSNGQHSRYVLVRLLHIMMPDIHATTRVHVLYINIACMHPASYSVACNHHDKSIICKQPLIAARGREPSCQW